MENTSKIEVKERIESWASRMKRMSKDEIVELREIFKKRIDGQNFRYKKEKMWPWEKTKLFEDIYISKAILALTKKSLKEINVSMHNNGTIELTKVFMEVAQESLPGMMYYEILEESKERIRKKEECQQ